MKLPPLIICLIAAATLHAQDPAALTASVLDAAGGTSAGGDVEITGSLGGFGGISSEVSGGPPATARAGFPGQIYDPVTVAITPGEATLFENDIRLFTAAVVCDDDTLLSGATISWSADSLLLTVTPDGAVSTGLLPGSLAATLTATAGAVSGTAVLTVADSDPDNYGDYAGDGVPDAWQLSFFGPGNPSATPSVDFDADGLDNVTEWLAGTDPTDPNSLLQVAFSGDLSLQGMVTLIFSPYLPDRTYSLEESSGIDGPWTALPGIPTDAPTPGEGMISHTQSSETRKFYRLKIGMPPDPV